MSCCGPRSTAGGDDVMMIGGARGLSRDVRGRAVALARAAGAHRATSFNAAQPTDWRWLMVLPAPVSFA